jgi:hypothetical protein
MSYDLVDNMEYIQAFKKKSTAWKTLKNRVSFLYENRVYKRKCRVERNKLHFITLRLFKNWKNRARREARAERELHPSINGAMVLNMTIVKSPD